MCSRGRAKISRRSARTSPPPASRPPHWISASPAAGAIRWTGDASVDRLQRLRRTLAGLEVPLTLERAPWPLRGAVGHFGAYREGVGPLVAGLRRTFDPGGALVVATEGT